MNIIENFLVNTNNFEPIIQALIQEDDVPAKITDSYFKSIGFQNPSDLLVIHLLKGLRILQEDGSTTGLFSELRNPETTRMAVAKGVSSAYEGLFQKEPEAYKMQTAELLEIFSEIFQGQKTELILKYMTNTFTTLVSFAGNANIEKVLANKPGENNSDSVLEIAREVAEVHKNGSSAVNGTDSTLNGTGSPPKEDEDKSDISFEELVGLSSNDEADTVTPPHGLDIDQNEKENEDKSHNIVNFDNSEQSIPDVSGNVNKHESAEENFFESAAGNNKPASQETQGAQQSQQENTLEDYFTQTNGSNHKPGENGQAFAIPNDNNPTAEAEEKLQKALIKKADLLYKLDHHEDVLPILEKIISNFGQSGKPFLKEAVSRSVIRRAMILWKLQRYDLALPALDMVISKFANSDNQEFYEQASVAMLYKAQILESKNQLDQALPLFNSIIERLGDSTNPQIKSQINNIVLKRLDVLLASGRDDEVLAAADQLIERFRNSDENPQHLEEAMFRKAEALEKMGKDEEALQAYSEFLERFGDNISAF